MKALGVLATVALLTFGAAPVAAVDWTTLPIEELRHHANGNEVAAMEEIGRRLIQGVNAPKDLRAGAGWLLRAAEAGSASSAYSVAAMYERGFIFDRDSQRAVEWYRKAAEGNVALAKHNLAVMLRDGRGAERNDQEAIELLRSAAHQGLLVSMVLLGEIHERDDGVPVNLATALAWYAIAAEYDRQVNRGQESTLAKTAAERAAALQQALPRAELLQAQDLAQAEYKRIRETLAPPKPVPAPSLPSAAAEPPPAVASTPVDDEALGWPKDPVERVRVLQQVLLDLKLLRDKPDGVLGPMTRAALRDAQRAAGLAETGEPTRELFVALKANRRDVVDNSPLPTPPKVEAAAAPVPAPAETDAWPSDRADQIKAIQTRLRDLKLYTGSLTGQLGPVTQAAIRDFQRTANLAQTGEPSRELYLALKAAPAPPKMEAAAPPSPPVPPSPAPPDPAPAVADGWPAERSEQLKAIQILLRDLKYYSGGPTGQLGPTTQAAIRDFQRAANLPQTAEPSRELYLALKAAPAPPKAEAAAPPPQPVPPSPAPPDPPPAVADGWPADRGEQIKAIQVLLRELKYYNGGPTGQLGPMTQAAIRDFQRTANLTQTGEPGRELYLALKSAPPAMAASAETAPVNRSAWPAGTVERVRTIQALLRDLGFYTADVDGLMGDQTRTAIGDFQRSQGLEETGEPSESLFESLKSSGATATLKPN